MSTLVSIGEFSRLTHLSVKALRHYHELGVLVPSSVDGDSGYRNHDLSQLPDAHIVRRLRDLAMPLEDVRDVLNAATTAEREEAIGTHLARLDHQLAHTREMVASLRQLLEGAPLPFDVTVRALEPVTALSIEASVTSEDIEDWSNETFTELDAIMLREDISIVGAPGSLFDEAFCAENEGLVTAFVPTSPEIGDGPAGCLRMGTPGGHYAGAVHRGPHSNLDRTYGAVGGYANEYRLRRAGPIREHYLVRPPQAEDPSQYRTELLWPVIPTQ